MNTRVPGGFTLIELLVALAIVALLLTIALPRFLGSLEKSKEVALQEDLKVMRASLDRFLADNGRFPASLEELVEKKYLRAIPVDPVTESSETWIAIIDRDTEGNENGVADVRSGAQGYSREGLPYENF
jgi:prepilin-type N-terminal cleavage/methylation domain-containing protein